MVVHSSIKNTAPDAVTQALEIVTETESGKRLLDIGEYRKATEILKDSDINDHYLKFQPLLTPKVIEAINIAKRIYRSVYGKGEKKNNRFTSEILKLNRKLSHYAKDEDWAEDMNIAGIFTVCRNHRIVHSKKFFENLNHALFPVESANKISLFIFGPPNMDAIYPSQYANGIPGWKKGVIDFLEELDKAPVPCRIIFCAMQIDVLYVIKHDLKKRNPKAWKHMRHLSRKDQLWYHGKIVQILRSMPNDPHVLDILNEYQVVSMKIFQLLGLVKPELIATEG